MAVDLRKKYGIELIPANYGKIFDEILVEHRFNTMTVAGQKAYGDAVKQSQRIAPPVVNYTIRANQKAQRQARLIKASLRKEIIRNFNKAQEIHRKAGGKAILRDGEYITVHPTLKDRLFDALHVVMSPFINNTPGLGLPGALAGIVSTETTGAFNDGVIGYIERYREQHPGVTIYKKWVQRRELSIMPRNNHSLVNGKTIRYEAPFRVPNGKGGFDWMDSPHAANAPLDQIVNCHCVIDFRIEDLNIRKSSTVKKTSYEIGHISTHADGTKWKKVGIDEWEQINSGNEQKGNTSFDDLFKPDVSKMPKEKAERVMQIHGEISKGYSDFFNDKRNASVKKPDKILYEQIPEVFGAAGSAGYIRAHNHIYIDPDRINIADPTPGNLVSSKPPDILYHELAHAKYNGLSDDDKFIINNTFWNLISEGTNERGVPYAKNFAQYSAFKNGVSYYGLSSPTEFYAELSVWRKNNTDQEKAKKEFLSFIPKENEKESERLWGLLA